MSTTQLLPLEAITTRICVQREQRVLLDRDLAALYGVTTKRFNEQVKRNLARFPADFIFQLTAEEEVSLRSQFATLKSGRGAHRKYLPYAFSEHGAVMAAMVLNSPRAIEVSVFVVRAFVQLKALAMQHDTFSHNTRNQLRQVFEALRELTVPPDRPKRTIGFIEPQERKKDKPPGSKATGKTSALK